MGNCTATVKRVYSEGPYKEVIADIAMSTSYATGGDTLPLSALGLGSCDVVNLCAGAGAVLGHALAVIHGATPGTAPKIFARDVATGTEVSNATPLQTEIVRCIAKGEGPF
jgi:hypothetical protein